MEDQNLNVNSQDVLNESGFSENVQEQALNSDNASHTVPLGALLEERKKFQKQIEEEKSLRQSYEDIFNALNSNNNPTPPTNQNDELANILMNEYENIRQTHGEAAANNWLDSQLADNPTAIQADNQNILHEVQEKHKDIYAVPEVKKAIDAYLAIDMDSNMSLREQGFPEVVEYISSLYKSGYEAGLNLREQNNAAKARMGSSINSSMPSVDGGRVFSRADIAAMDVDTFSKYENEIFKQMKNGLIK